MEMAKKLSEELEEIEEEINKMINKEELKEKRSLLDSTKSELLKTSTRLQSLLELGGDLDGAQKSAHEFIENTEAKFKLLSDLLGSREGYEKGLERLDEENNDQREEIVTEIIEREQLTENRAELADKIESELGLSYVR